MNGQTAFVTTVVPLPTFYEPGVSMLNGYMWSSTDEEAEVYAPFQMELTQGRLIRVPPNVSKYKVEIQFGNLVYDLVGMTLEPIDLVSFRGKNSGKDVIFYPILMHQGRQCILFIDAINEVFAATKMVESLSETDVVTSPMEFVSTLENFISHTGINVTDIYDFRYSNMIRFDKIPDMVMEIRMSESATAMPFDQTLEERYGIPNGAIPYQIEAIAYCGYFRKLKSFMAAMRYVPDIEFACAESMKNWDAMRLNLLGSGKIPEYVSDSMMTELEDTSFTGRWLGDIYCLPENDFTFPIRTRSSDIGDFYIRRYDTRNAFDSKSYRIDNWQDLMDNFITSFQLSGKFPERDMTVHRTWLEDLIVQDAQTGETLLYVDMIYWALACAEGLINKRNLSKLFELNV